ncbi:hypothetical protein ACQUQU_12860 [Thalassolituus sp. LLYu03]|uniref:hypothetical protein n=1 Tax=Thalassolituus sp. LLYu03 TaxID=3421656 RepID=UPI003D2CD2F9
MTAEGKRRAVYTVLSEFLDGDDLWAAMWRWQNGYSDKSQFELNAFLSECRDIPEISLNRSVLYRQLIGILMSNNAALKDDPIRAMQNFLNKQEASGELAIARPKVADWTPTFSMVLKELFAQLRSDTARSVKNYAAEQAARNQLAQGFIYAFTLWDQGKTLDVSAIQVSDLKKLLNFIYIGLCESLGPVEADKILSSAVTDVADAIGVGKLAYPDPRILLQK